MPSSPRRRMAKDGRGGTICVRESESNQIRLFLSGSQPDPAMHRRAGPARVQGGATGEHQYASRRNAERRGATSESIESMTVLDDITGHLKNLAVDMFPVPPESARSIKHAADT